MLTRLVRKIVFRRLKSANGHCYDSPGGGTGHCY